MTNKDNISSRRVDSAGPAAERGDKLFFADTADLDGYEEPDRDTAYAEAYREEQVDADKFDDALPDETPTHFDGSISLRGETTPPLRVASLNRDRLEAAETGPTDAAPNAGSADAPETGQPERDWQEEDYYPQDSAVGQTWPPLLIAMAAVAVLLLVAGGYGVLQQRSATQEEIRQLQAALATSVDPAAVAEERQSLVTAKQRNSQLQSVIDALTLENRRLTDTVAGLEQQLRAQQVQRGATEPVAAASATVAATPADETAGTAPAAIVTEANATAASAVSAAAGSVAEARAPAAPAAAPTGGDWFVNFASYGVRETAQSWADRIEPTAGKAAIVMGSRGDRSYYRVRVVDLPDRAAAERVAEELATEHGLAELWVGRR